jgi:hypothetical protein
MQKLIIEQSGEGLVKLMGEVVTLFCVNYFWTGTLIGVNETCVLLQNPQIVYETGEWKKGTNWQDAQSLNVPEIYVMISAIEAFGVMTGSKG